jgi:GNAT superfamily N-acetyltransferase
MQVRVERVAPESTFPLRRRVLRPHLPGPEHTVLPGERDPRAVHLAALDADGQVIGTAVLLPERFELMPDRADAWRLRGMATDERLRGRGIGRQVVRRVLEHLAAQGGGLLWCHARLPAQAFYERAGLMPVGACWEEPRLGPHVAMWREVPPSGQESGPLDVSGRPG